MTTRTKATRFAAILLGYVNAIGFCLLVLFRADPAQPATTSVNIAAMCLIALVVGGVFPLALLLIDVCESSNA